MTCKKTQLLDAVVSHEVPPHVESELLAHAAGCARCRHELAWLRSERALFRQRAGREEVHRLYRHVAPPPAPRSWARLLGALAGAVVMAVGLGQVNLVGLAGRTGADASIVLESQPLMSTFEPRACSTLEAGLGFFCGRGVPASFVASR